MGCVGVDRISELPEPLIHHILSFLPTKQAVSTTVLSKTWNNLWVSLPVLDFRQWGSKTDVMGTKSYLELQSDTNRFMEFIDKTLFSNNVSTVKKFCLSVDTEYFDDYRLRQWIISLISRNIEELVLTGMNWDWERSKPIPVDLFTCESLTMLDLNFVHQRVLDLPQSISLPRLKVLRLSSVTFKDNASAQQLFSNCPILEELALRTCRQMVYSDVISFSAPRLKFLKGAGYYGCKLRLEIDAPNLVSIEYGAGCLPIDCLVGSFPSLVEADFREANSIITTRLRDSLSEFVRTCTNVKLLKASSNYFKIFDTAEVPSTSFPTFNNLMRLEVSYNYSTSPLRSLIKFLHLSPNLESLVVHQRLKVDFPDKDTWYEFRSSNTAPRCCYASSPLNFKILMGSLRRWSLLDCV